MLSPPHTSRRPSRSPRESPRAQRQTNTRGRHYCTWTPIDASIVPASLRSHWSEGPPGTAYIIGDMENQ